jgi:hypothetical protein
MLYEKKISELVDLYLKDFAPPKAEFEEVICGHKKEKIRKADMPGYFSGNTMSYDIDNKAIGLKVLKEWAIAVVKEIIRLDKSLTSNTDEQNRLLFDTTDRFLIDRFELTKEDLK